MRPRPKVFDLYWYFAAERHAILERREAGAGAPWTSDRILQTFKFCNTYRAADRVSQYLIRDVIYAPKGAPSAEDQLFQIVLFRLFSKVDTWRALTERLGAAPTIECLRDGSLVLTLDGLRDEGQKLYTGAFILCATDAYGKHLKHRNHVALLADMFLEGGVGRRVLEAPSFASVYALLHSFPLLGDFMSYQIAVDLNYSPHLSFSENSFTKAGPGALRGITKAFLDTGRLKPEEVISWMVDHQEEEFARLGIRFGGLRGRKLHAIDCQGLFCELDKYCREAVPALKSARTRIKARFTPSTDTLAFFFPPKWGINQAATREIPLLAPPSLRGSDAFSIPPAAVPRPGNRR